MVDLCVAASARDDRWCVDLAEDNDPELSDPDIPCNRRGGASNRTDGDAVIADAIRRLNNEEFD